MKARQQLGVLAVLIYVSSVLLAQETQGSVPAKKPASVATPEWQYNLIVDGYIMPDGTSYVDPVFTANRHWLHVETRYDYEDLRTGSLWVGYNFAAGKKLVLDVTPMIGGVFGRTNGIAPGCEASLTYKRIQLSISNEYVFDTTHKSGNYYYSWPELTYSPTDWFRVGAVGQHTKVFHTSLSVQRGFLVGLSRKQWEFTTYVFNLGFTQPTAVLEVGVDF